MNKTCTSTEQSKRLIELGIDINSADMHYVRKKTDFMGNPVDGKWSEPRYGNTNSKYAKYIVQNFSSYETLPAWSLSALLELIPPYLGEFEDGIDFDFSKAINGKWYSAHYIKLNDNGLASFNKAVTGDTAVDAAFEMICWLKENNKLKSL